jgi:NADH-quinone oxidoreductase subunit N
VNVTVLDWIAILPALLVLAAAMLVVGIDLFAPPRKNQLALVLVSFAGIGGACWLLVQRLHLARRPLEAFSGSIVLDDLTSFLSIAILMMTALLVLVANVDTRRRNIAFGEYYGLVLSCSAAMMLLVASTDLLMIFLNLEILSIALYVLTGITRKNPRSNEAAVKYLVTGAFATGFQLFGVALLYGATGSIQLEALGSWLATNGPSPLFQTGLGLLIVGFLFKIGAVPFHMWVPDVYEGAPTTTTAFMSVTVKAAAVGSLVRILLVAAPTHPELWADLLSAVAIATMVIGNLIAIQQTSVKRMLAYSSVAHTGYVLVALAAMHGVDGTLSVEGASAALFYLVAYSFMTFGAFVTLVYVGHEAPVPGREPEWQDGEHIDDLAGLGVRRPWAAFAMTLFLVSLGGIPPTAGFFGKFLVFSEAIAQGHVGLAVIGVLASLVSMVYYLRVVVAMYMQSPLSNDEQPEGSLGLAVALAAAGTVLLGILPNLFFEWATRSIVLLGA